MSLERRPKGKHRSIVFSLPRGRHARQWAGGGGGGEGG